MQEVALQRLDSVLTSIEMQQLLDQEGIDLRNVPEVELDSIVGGHSSSLSGLPGGSGEQCWPYVCLGNLMQRSIKYMLCSLMFACLVNTKQSFVTTNRFCSFNSFCGSYSTETTFATIPILLL